MRNRTIPVRRRWLGWAAASWLATLGVGCIDDGDELRHALRAHIGDAQPPCLKVALPLTLAPDQPALRDALRGLVRAGWLVEHDQIQAVPLSRTGSLWVPHPRFELTERGRRHYREDLGGFCLPG